MILLDSNELEKHPELIDWEISRRAKEVIYHEVKNIISLCIIFFNFINSTLHMPVRLV